MKINEQQSDIALLLTNPYFIQKKLLRDAIVQEIKNLKSGICIDVGCGYRPYKVFFSDFQYIGLDISIERSPDIVSTVMNIPLGDEIADTVICTELIEHTPDPWSVCKEISCLIKPGGFLLISAPMSWNLHYEPNDYYRFTHYGLSYILENVGFEIQKIMRVGGLSSLISARVSDVVHLTILRMPMIRNMSGKYALATFIVSPLNLVGYHLGRIFDPIDKTDAIGWFVVARKSNHKSK